MQNSDTKTNPAKQNKRKKEEKIQKKALKILEEYKNQMDEDLYQKSKEEILNENTKNTNN